MTARILVVDDVPANVKLLEVRLLAEYYEVLTATSGTEALAACKAGRVDVVLLDVMMPQMDGFEVCARIKADPATAHIPVIMVTALDQMQDRIRGLEAGADDFLTKPVNDLQLLTRVKSLVRLKMLTDELRLRATTTRFIGIAEMLDRKTAVDQAPPRVALVEQRPNAGQRLASMLRQHCHLDIVTSPDTAFVQIADGAHECVLISTALDDFDPLRLCSQIRTLDRIRSLPIILLAGEGEETRLMRALELGVNDYLIRPLDKHELIARLRTQIRRKRYDDQLRRSIAETIEMAVVDALTGLNNRRYLDTHLATLVVRAQERDRPLSLLITDIDRFKAINDRWGHDVGDEVLKEFAVRLRQNIRGIDLACRMGGEEFVVVMPDTEFHVARQIAERLRTEIAELPFPSAGVEAGIAVTVSVGVSSLAGLSDTPAALLKRADMALYQAKHQGRNRVVGLAA